MSPKKSKKEKSDKLNIGDRLITGFLGAALSLVIGSVIWFFLVVGSASPRGKINPKYGVDGFGEEPFSYWVILVISGVIGLIGFFIGPERMMNGFGHFFGLFGNKDED